MHAATRRSCRTTACSTTTAWTSILTPVGRHKRPSTGPVEDKVYFFRYLILEGDLVYFSSQPMSDARYGALASFLALKGTGKREGNRGTCRARC